MKAYVVLIAAVVLAAGCREEPMEERPMTPESHRAEIQAWQARRAERLRAEDGWLTLVGLHWLNEGENTISIASQPAAPPLHLVRNGAKVTLQPTAPMTIDGKVVTSPVELKSDADPNGPTIVRMGTVRFQVIERGPRYGLRVKDSQSPTRTQFAGLDYFPIDGKWRVDARFEPYDPPKKIPITDVTGMTSDSISPGALVFTVDGKEYRLDPVLEEGTDELFIIFRDRTSIDATYPAGRYLYAAKPGENGRTIVDFNKAYNPPCAFTPFATCPLPPLQNRLPIRIEAGEKKYGKGHP